MKIKERIKNCGFWVSLISSVFLILGAFGIEIADETVSSVINGVCSALVVLGIISDPTAGKGYLDAAKLGSTETEEAPTEVDVSAEIALADAESAAARENEADGDDQARAAAQESAQDPAALSK